jgi:hypothetical protein
VSVQGPGAIAVHVNPISVNVPVNVPPIHVQQLSPPPAGGQPVSGMASPAQVSDISPSSGSGTSGQQAAAGAAAAGAAAPLPSPPSASSSGAVTLIQNGPGNFITSDVLRNLGPGAILVQNTLNDQVIQGLTVINAQVSGLGSLIRSDVFSNLHLTLRGFGR